MQPSNRIGMEDSVLATYIASIQTEDNIHNVTPSARQ